MWLPLSNLFNKVLLFGGLILGALIALYSKITIEKRKARKEILDEIKKDTSNVENQWTKIDRDNRTVDESLRRLRE